MVQPGDRIQLDHTTDEYTFLEPGDTGTVTSVNTLPAGLTGGKPEQQIDVDWDTGSTLSLIRGEDKFTILTEENEH